MRKIIASLFITLDGVVEAPGGGGTTLPEKRGWSQQFMMPEIGQLIFGQMDASDALLLGRVTYEGFAAFWPNMPADDPFAQRMNGFTKYVVTTTLDRADWLNSSLVTGDIPAEIAILKQQAGQNIAITGSGTLVESLLPTGLIDELQLCVCPIVLGVGKRLFKGGHETNLRLVESRTFSSGMVLSSYQPMT
jgi:dihydrofolate reductase